jgi:hypothetical protein
MNAKKSTFMFVAVAVTILALVAFPSSAYANHSWGGYHWARTANPFTIKLGDNVSGAWDSMLVTASSDWSKSTVMDTTVVAGGARPKNCRPTSGRVEVCNASYGNTGWLGVAQIWLTGGTHIVQGTVKNNDYYFGNSTYQYNNTAEMQHVICQEIGHTFGLDHQSTDGTSLNTCMDYYHNTSASDTKSTHPNQHDYDELATIYSHLDSFTTIGSAPVALPSEMVNGDFSSPNSWGKLVSSSAKGDESVFVRDFGKGNQVVTLVIWAQQ